MSNTITVNIGEFSNVLRSLRVLVPKGEISMPIGVYVDNGLLNIVCTQGCLYQSEINVNETASKYSATVLYRDISPLLPNSGIVELGFDNYGLEIRGEGFDASFPNAYSIVERKHFKDIHYSEILSGAFTNGLKTILNVGLERLYSKVSPILVFNSVAIQKFPNIWIQTRVTGLPISAILDTTHVDLINKFEPTHVSSDQTGVLTFKNRNSVLQVPCKVPQDSTTIVKLLEDMKMVIKIHIGSYLERLRSVIKFGSKEYCKIALHTEGFRSTITHENSSVSVSAGNVNSDTVAVVELPVQLWLSILKAVNSETVEILRGGGKLCLRTPFTIIVTRVLN